MYNTFIMESKSADGIPVLIAGIYKDADKNNIIESYNHIKRKILFRTKDVYMIDYILAEEITKISPQEVVAVGACIRIDGINLATGGVIGSPFEDNESADGLLERINDDIFIVASPGNMGIAFVGDKELGLELEKFLMDETRTQEECISEVQKIAEKKSDLYFIISDGCGENRIGTAVTYENRVKIKKIIPLECL